MLRCIKLIHQIIYQKKKIKIKLIKTLIFYNLKIELLINKIRFYIKLIFNYKKVKLNSKILMVIGL
jgi:hypothetical protein